jgi:hypothetical protein
MAMRDMRLVSAFAVLMPFAAAAQADRPRIEDFRTDLTPAAIDAAQSRQMRALAAQAYLWGLPAFLHYRQATEIRQARAALAPGEEPFGGWFLLRSLATPADRNNVMPNVDTLYGASYVLLDRQGPVVVSVPRIKGRYYSIALHDAWFNTFGIIGTSTNDGEAANVLILPPDWKGRVEGRFSRIIRAPTSGIALFQRIYVRDEKDVPVVRELQDQIRLRRLKDWRSAETRFPRIDTPEFLPAAPVRETRDPLRYFELMSAHACRNRPPSGEASLVDAFTRAGLGPCATLPESAAMREAIVQGVGDAQALLNARVSTPVLRNGWVVPDPNTGRASADYVGRAVVQLTQIASFSPDEAIYTIGRLDGSGRPLVGRHRYTLTFPPGQLPPVDPRAFWSLTMYDGSTNLLVANAIDRYALRPTTPGLTRNADGGLTLHLASQRPVDEPEGNWLPAPAGPFIVVLRTYMPQEAIRSGRWFPPAIMRDD